MAVFRSANKVIVRDSHPFPQATKLCGYFIGILLRRFSGGLRGAFNLLPVLIGASQKKRLVAQKAVPPRDGIAGDGRVGVPDVRPRVHVINRRRDVELLAHSWFEWLVKSKKAKRITQCTSVSPVFKSFCQSEDTPVRLPALPFSTALDSPLRSAGNLHTRGHNL